MNKAEAIAILEISKHMATSGRLYNQAIDMAIEALSEPIDENREIIKDILQMMPTAYLLDALGVATFDELMDSERTGEWIWSDEDMSWKCGNCGCVFEEIDWKPEYNFCPNCGSRMESEDK